jgi:hypothetical protein
VKINEWDLVLPSCDLRELNLVLELVNELKKQGVTRAAVATSFCRWMIQPIKDQVHPAYEYWGKSDPCARSTVRSPRMIWWLEFPRCNLGK